MDRTGGLDGSCIYKTALLIWFQIRIDLTQIAYDMIVHSILIVAV